MALVAAANDDGNFSRTVVRIFNMGAEAGQPPGEVKSQHGFKMVETRPAATENKKGWISYGSSASSLRI